jgi:hypothetical protein
MEMYKSVREVIRLRTKLFTLDERNGSNGAEKVCWKTLLTILITDAIF